MTATTPNYAIPYPEITDFVKDGATAMEAIAEKVDDILSTGAAARNLLYNGAMQVAQRTTSVTGKTTGDYYTVDRWYLDLSSLGTWSMSQASTAASDDFPGATTGTYSGFRASAKMTMTSTPPALGTASVAAFHQRLEGRDLQAIRKGKPTAQQLFVSFWVKSSKTGTYIFELYDNDNSRQVSKSYSISTANTWEYKTLTIPADTTGMFDNDNNLSLYVIWWLAAGTQFTSGTLNTSWASVTTANRAVGQTNLTDTQNAYFQITGVQMTVGTVNVPYQFKKYQDDLRECMRYYQKIDYPGTGPGVFAMGAFGGSTQPARCLLHLHVPMRTIVYAADFAAAGNYWINAHNIANYNVSAIATNVYSGNTAHAIEVCPTPATSAGAAGTTGMLVAANTAAYVGAIAEL